MPYDIKYEIGNKESIEAAIIKTGHNATEDLREMLGDSIFVLSLLVILNSIIAIIFIFKKSNDKNT
jgi:hypothetical protein